MANSFLDIIFPKRCVGCGSFGGYLCKSCFSKINFDDRPVCAICRRQAIGGVVHPSCKSRFGLDGLVFGARYRGSIKKLIVNVKYKWVFDVGEILCGLIENNLWKFSLPKDTVLVPVPLHRNRQNWRGFNQSVLISEILSKKFKIRSKDILKRIVETKTQVGLSRAERKRNINGAFVSLAQPSKDVTYILVDDVYTTGSTMAEACKMLKRAGALCVWGLVVALD